MCGIISYSGCEISRGNLEEMLHSINHRGPDEGGVIQYGTVGLAMRRLSIIDLTNGSQPMFTSDGKISIVYNGEIYNYLILKKELEEKGYSFKTKSDTEVFLYLYVEYGEKCLEKILGMFSVSIYDSIKQELFVARDRLGVKPLYYWKNKGSFIFASEIKAIIKAELVSVSPNLKMVSPYLSFRYVPGPETLFENIYKFPAAHFAIIKNNEMKLHKYWSPYALKKDYAISETEAQEKFNFLFEEAVKRRLIADVPLGAFLSGGLDSSAIVIAMKKFSLSPVKTFSIGFNWIGDELKYASKFAKSLSCEHQEIYCQEDDIKFLPEINWYLDEPIGDPIVLPMFLLSKAAHPSVKVVLTGEGADEILAGYFPHKALMMAQMYKKVFPAFVQKNVISKMVSFAPPSVLNLLFDYPASLGKKGKEKLKAFLDVVNNQELNFQYRHAISLFDQEDKEELFLDKNLIHEWKDEHFSQTLKELTDEHDDLDQILALQYHDWLPDDILNKSDKMLMANSIEGRVPFLDHKLVEFMNSLPAKYKIGLKNKIPLRNYLIQNNAGEIAQRKKKAFYLPLEQFGTKNIFNNLINEYLSLEKIKKRGLFNHAKVEKLKESMGKGEFIYDKQLFSILMLELWFSRFMD